MVKDVTVYLRSNHMAAGLPHFICNAPVNMQVIYWERTIAGSRKWVLAFTSNKEYWKQNRKDV